MPVLTRFPGGGGGTGYKHYIGNTKNISVKTGASNTVCLNWEDPENFIVDGNPLSEWKGSIVVAKEGTPPQSIDDGIRVAEVTEKNKYKIVQLITEIGGSGYYYGIFPYTKDFVVNEDKANTKLLEATLENSSWGLIDDMSQNGRASTLWSIGDEKEVSIEEYGKIKFQIAGFDHDDLTDGTGKAGITFIAESLVGNLTVTQLYTGVTDLKNLLLEIKDKMPPDLNSVIKNVSHTWGNAVQAWESYLFAHPRWKLDFLEKPIILILPPPFQKYLVISKNTNCLKM